MNTLRSRLFAALATASLLTALASAQPVARTYSSAFFFGDSLTDAGNLFAAIGQPPAPYVNGHFSNGPTYAEQLIPGLQPSLTAAPTVVTNLDFAFGGATAVGSTPIPATLSVQLGMFQARGITPKATDLFVLWAGANDVLNGIANPATQNFTAINSIATGAAAAVTGAVQTLATAGARRFLVMNLPDISQTPRFTTGSGAPAASLANAGSLTFNASIRSGLAGASLPAGANVTVVNVQSLLNLIIARPAAFGFTVTNKDIVDILTGGGSPGDPAGYVFFDSIHPTTKAHGIIAKAVTEILNPEFVLGPAGTQGTSVLALADLSADTVDARLDQIRAGVNRHAFDGYVSFTYKDGGRDFTGYQPGFDYSARVVTAGIDTPLRSNLVGGLAFSAENLSSRLNTWFGAGRFGITGATGAAYLQWKSGQTFVEGSVSYGYADVNNISRPTSLATYNTTGTTSGNRYGASLKIGHGFKSGSLRFTPFASLRYTNGKLDAYDESGVDGLNFSYGEQKLKGLDGRIGVTADYILHAGDQPLVLGLSGVYSSDLERSSRTLSGRLADNLSQLTDVPVNDGNGDSLKAGAHVTGSFSRRWSWTAAAGIETRNDGKDAHQYSLSVQTGF